jgi:hypothetical protein
MKNPMPRHAHIFLALIAMFFAADSDAAIDWAFEDTMQEIVDQINEGSGQAFSDALDVDALMGRVFQDVEIGEVTKAGFSRDIQRRKKQIGDNMVRKIADGYYAILLNVDQNDDEAVALVRYDAGDLRFGYHAYELKKDDAGNVRIVDWLDYVDGAKYSEALRLNVVAFEPTAASVRSLVPGFQGSDEDYAKFADVISAYSKKEYQKFYDVSVTLPQPIRRTRFMHMLTCIVSRMTRDRNLYNEAYRELAKNFGNDPRVAMTLIPYFFERRDADKAMETERVLQEALDYRDGALLAFMARTALGVRKVDEASILADEAISTEPTLEAAYWAAIDAHVLLDHFSFAVMTAKSLEDQFEKSIERERFEDNSMYGEFVESSHYQQWQREKQQR